MRACAWREGREENGCERGVEVLQCERDRNPDPTPNAQRPTPEHNHDPAPHLLVHPGVNARDEHRSPSVVHVDSVALVRPLKAQDAPAALGVRWRGGRGEVITGDCGQF